MIKYIFWDFNGTILDDLELSLDLLNEILVNENKSPITKEKYLEIFGFPIRDYYKKAGIFYDDENFMRIANYFIENYQPKSLLIDLHEGIKELLEYFYNNGVKNICLSASEINNLEEQLKHYDIYKYFHKVIGTDNVIALGKDTLGINYLKEEKIDPKEALYIGDTTYDYEISKKMGIKCLLFTKGHHSIKRLKSTGAILINNINDIIKCIKGDVENEKVF